MASPQDTFLFAEAVNVATFVAQGTGLRYVNAAAVRMTGYEHAELLRMRFWDVMHLDDQGLVREHGLARQAGAVLPQHLECRMRRKDGATVWVDYSGVRIEYEGLPGLLDTVVDITDRKDMETALRRSDGRLRRLVDANILAMNISDTRGRLIQANDTFLGMLGYTRDDPPARWDVLTPPEWRALDGRAIRSLRETGVAPPWEKECLHRDGHRVPVLIGAALLDRDEEECLCFIIDLTERKRAERALAASLAELQASKEHLRRLAASQVVNRDAERKRRGFDLHDNVCQELIGIDMMIASVRQRLESGAPESARELGRASGYIKELVEHLRHFARELGPFRLRDLGLEEGLRSLASHRSSPQTSITIDIPHTLPPLGDDLEMTIYRVTREAIANALRHASPQSVEIKLQLLDETLRLEIRDDGCGFDPAARPPDAVGLTSMEERAFALGGGLRVQSARGAGTSVTFQCPVDARACSSQTGSARHR